MSCPHLVNTRKQRTYKIASRLDSPALDWRYPSRSTTASRRSSQACAGPRWQSRSSSSWPSRCNYKCLHQTAPPYLAEKFHQSSADETVPSVSRLCFNIIVCRPMHVPVFQPSAIELFRSPLPDCGTLCPRRTSRHWLFLGNASRQISSIVLSPNFPLLPAQWLRHFGRHNRDWSAAMVS